MSRPRWSVVAVLLLVSAVSARESRAQLPPVAVIHSFPPAGPSNPGSITQTPEGDFLVTTGNALTRVGTDGSTTVLNTLPSSCYSSGALVLAPDGWYYGTAICGEPQTTGRVYRVTRDGAYTDVFAFSPAQGVPGPRLVRIADGTLIGAATAPSRPAALFFTITSDGVLHPGVFAVEGANDRFAVAPDGTIYGINETARAVYHRLGDGSVINVVALHSLYGADVAVTPDGTLVGIAASNNGCAVYRYDATNGYHQLTPPDYSLCGFLRAGRDGNVYGAAGSQLFRVTAESGYERLGGADAPVSDVTQVADGRLWGTTRNGGINQGGSVFSLASAGGGLTTVANFASGAAEGAHPVEPMVALPDGYFYGAAPSEGVADSGTIFRVSRTGVLNVVHTFSGGPDGGSPAHLTAGPDGFLYGISSGSLIFKLAPSGEFRVHYKFDPGSCCTSFGLGSLTVGTDGWLYGLIASKPYPRGAVYRVSVGGGFEIVHAFTDFEGLRVGYCDLGADSPYCSVNHGPAIGAPAGGVYVLADFIGSTALIHVGADGLVQTAHVFGPGDGLPNALIAGIDGTVYGSTQGYVGARYGSRLFSVTGNGKFTWIGSVAAFTLRLQLGDGTFIGTAAKSVLGQWSVVLVRLTPQLDRSAELRLVPWKDEGRFTFPWKDEERLTFTDGGDGRIYATDAYGGANGIGSILSVEVPPFPPVVSGFPGIGGSDVALYHPGTGTWSIRSNTGTTSSIRWGVASDIPVPGDYDGDGQIDVAVFRPATGTWFILTSSSQFTESFSRAWGRAGDIPVPADYTGNGVTELAVFRPSTGTWYIEGQSAQVYGRAGDIPVPGDYAGAGYAQLAVYRPGDAGVWLIYGQPFPITFGGRGDIPVPADYDGVGHTERALFVPSQGRWIVAFGQTLRSLWGAPGDIPVPQDLDGDGRAEFVVYRPRTHEWFALNGATGWTASFPYGASGDTPLFAGRFKRGIVGDVEGDRMTDLTLFRPGDGTWHSLLSLSQFTSELTVSLGAAGDTPLLADFLGDHTPQRAAFHDGAWAIDGGPTINWGTTGDLPVTADFDGDGRADITVFRDGGWYVLTSTSDFTASMYFSWGAAGDIAVAADYDGDGKADPAVFRAGVWFILLSSTDYTQYVGAEWGIAGDVPVVGDYDGDRLADIAVYRPSNGVWYIRQSSDASMVVRNFGAAPGDVPVPGDYDGDGRTDAAVFRSGSNTWWVWYTLGGQFALTAGAPGDVPVLPSGW